MARTDLDASAPPVRAMTPLDIDAVRAIGRAAGERFRSVDDPRVARCGDDPPFTVDELQAYVDRGHAWVATVDGVVAGFLVVEQLRDSVHVEEVAVHPDHEGRGLGTALLGTAAAHARHHGIAAVTLTTFRDVPWNAPFYSRRGFVVLDEHELTDELRALRADEDAHGLPADLRVVMRRPAS